MAIAVTGDIVRVEWPIRWIERLLALPFLAAGTYFLWNVALGLPYDLVGLNRFSEDWGGLLVALGLGLAIAIPGVVLATYRYFVVVDRTLREIVVTRAFGPLKLRTLGRLTDYHFIGIVDDRNATMYEVNLCGEKGTRPITLSGFSRRQEANDFGQQLACALKLPLRDLVGTEPDDPDLAETGS